MSQDISKYPLPFLTRDMLAFEHGTTFSLRVKSVGNSVVPLTIRGLTREGTFTFNHSTTDTGSLQTQDFRIPDIPILVSVTEPSGAQPFGHSYISVSLLANGDIIHELCSGYVFGLKGISYPATNNPPPRLGGGNISEVVSADPAAGDELNHNIPNGEIWHILAVRFRLVCAAAAASRRVHLQFSGANGWSMDCFSDIDQIISETRDYSCGNFGVGIDNLDDNDILLPIPGNIWLAEGASIKTRTTALNVGDNFSEMYILREQFFEKFG